MNTATGKKGFLLWLKQNLPRTYDAVSKEMKQSASLQGFGLVSPDLANSTGSQSASKSFADTIKDIATVYAQTYLTKKQIDAQNQVLNLQLQRAQQNLPPLNIDLESYGLPRPSVAVGVDSNTQKLLLWIGGGIGALWLLGKLAGRRA